MRKYCKKGSIGHQHPKGRHRCLNNILKTSQLTVVSTNDCTAQCAHCLMGSQPGRSGALTYAQIRDAVDALNNLNPLRLVVFTGGEPLLLGEDLLDAIAYVDSLGILTRVVTNAFWADTPENAKKMLITLREVGLNELNVSTDDFHLPYVPFENIRNVYNAIQGMGFGAFVLANSSSNGDIITPEYLLKELGNEFSLRFDEDRKSLPLPSPSQDGTSYVLSNGMIQRLGRASMLEMNGKARECDNCLRLSGGCGNAIVNSSLSPNGHFLACCGIESEGNEILDRGAFSSENVDEVFRLMNDDVLLNALIRLGPYFVRNFAASKEPSLFFPDKYATLCEVCQSVVLNDKAVFILKHNMGELASLVLLTLEAKENEKEPA